MSNSTRPPKAIFFDLDGTLVDSKPDVLAAFGAAFSGLGVTAPPEAEMVAVIGRPLEECFKVFLGADPVRVVEGVKLFRKHYSKHYLDGTRPFPGIQKSLRELSVRYQLCVATMKKGPYARDLIRALGWLGTFARVIGAEEGYPAKPDPTILHALCRGLDIRPDESVYVGDTALDLQMAKAAKIPFYFAMYGYGEVEEKDLSNVAGVIEDPHQLWSVLLASWGHNEVAPAPKKDPR